MLGFVVVLSLLASVFSFQGQANVKNGFALSARSKAVPFLDQPKALTGKLPGEVGFDPLGLSSINADKDWSELVVPNLWPEGAARTPITTIDWMREAEIKHSRIAMLAVVGWLAVDFGVRFPGAPESLTSATSSLAAHNAGVANGSMAVLLNIVAVLELMSGAAIYDQARGSGRTPGDFGFDPLGFGKNPKNLERYATNEVKNGRLAMLAFSGLVTQAALFPEKSFPYF